MLIHRFKKVFVLTAAVFIMVLALNAGTVSYAEDKGSDENGKDCVAVVNGVKIPAADLERNVDLIRMRYAGSGAQIGGQQLAQIRQTVLENLIEQQLLYQASKDEGFEADPGEVKKQMDQIRDRFESEEDFRNQLAQMNYSEETLEKEISKNLAIRKLIDGKFASKISVSNEEIESFYNDNKEEYEVPERIRARHILIRTDQEAGDGKKAKAREKIEEVKSKLEDGEDFSELAKEYSEDPSAESGGDLGYFSKGQMVESFDKAAFDMESGEISDIVETQFGYHLIKVEDRKQEGVQDLEEVEESIRENLEREKMVQELEPYIESLRQKYPVEKNLPE